MRATTTTVLIFKDRHGNAQPLAAPPPSGGLSTIDKLIAACGDAIGENNIRQRAERDAALAPLQQRIAVLEGQLAVVLTLLTGSNNNGHRRELRRCRGTARLGWVIADRCERSVR
jgi:hypothetical protein